MGNRPTQCDYSGLFDMISVVSGIQIHNFHRRVTFLVDGTITLDVTSRKSQIPLEIGYQRPGSKTRMTCLPGREISLTISSAVWIQYTNVTDRRTDTGRQQRPRLRA